MISQDYIKDTLLVRRQFMRRRIRDLRLLQYEKYTDIAVNVSKDIKTHYIASRKDYNIVSTRYVNQLILSRMHIQDNHSLYMDPKYIHSKVNEYVKYAKSIADIELLEPTLNAPSINDDSIVLGKIVLVNDKVKVIINPVDISEYLKKIYSDNKEPSWPWLIKSYWLDKDIGLERLIIDLLIHELAHVYQSQYYCKEMTLLSPNDMAMWTEADAMDTAMAFVYGDDKVKDLVGEELANMKK